MTIVIDTVEIEEIGDNPRQTDAGDTNRATHHLLNGCTVEVSNLCCDNVISYNVN